MQILAAEINFGYKFQSVRCLAFNGTPLRNLAHLARLVRFAQPAPEATLCSPEPCCRLPGVQQSAARASRGQQVVWASYPLPRRAQRGSLRQRPQPS